MDMMGISFDLMCVAGSKKNLNVPPKKRTAKLQVEIFQDSWLATRGRARGAQVLTLVRGGGASITDFSCDIKTVIETTSHISLAV